MSCLIKDLPFKFPHETASSWTIPLLCRASEKAAQALTMHVDEYSEEVGTAGELTGQHKNKQVNHIQLKKQVKNR